VINSKANNQTGCCGNVTFSQMSQACCQNTIIELPASSSTTASSVTVSDNNNSGSGEDNENRYRPPPCCGLNVFNPRSQGCCRGQNKTETIFNEASQGCCDMMVINTASNKCCHGSVINATATCGRQHNF